MKVRTRERRRSVRVSVCVRQAGLVGDHPVERFWSCLATLRDYPPGVVRVPEYLPGTAFFAASAGLYRPAGSRELPRFPFGGYMLVGHNLDAEGPFLARLSSGQSHGDPERPMRTWQNLYRLLSRATIDPRECFFTNAYVGLKAGSTPTGRFLGAKDPGFRRWCERFLLKQVEVMRPMKIATLGVDAARFMGGLVGALCDWDAPRLPPPEPRRIRIGEHQTTAVALAHPSGYHASLHKRRYEGLVGIDAEAALLRAAGS